MDDFNPYKVTCETPGCGNAGQEIEITAPGTDPVVMCGVCGQLITDVTPSGALS